MAEWDLTPVLAKYLDHHFVYGLLEFIGSKKIYDPEEIFNCKLKIFSYTNLVHPMIKDYEEHGLEVPNELYTELDNTETEKQDMIAELSEIFKCVGELNELDEKKTQEQIQVIKKTFPKELIDKLFVLARLFYRQACYTEAAAIIKSYQVLINPDDPHYINALWGVLACSIFSENWKEAYEYFQSLKNFIENSNMSPIQALQNRTWLIHWGLFIYFNIEHGRDFLVDLFFDSKSLNNKQGQNNAYLNAIHTSCPHILRYLTAAVITHRQRRIYMKELIRLIQSESYNYRDPITEFVECLYVNFDFDGAQKKLRACEIVLRIDFFLTACIDDFIENARLFIFEIFCQIHECISINMIADKLNMTIEDAERWIVKLIRDAHFDAKIDSKNGHVIMGTQAVSQYHQLIEKTKAMRLRTELLANNIDKTLNKAERNMWN